MREILFRGKREDNGKWVYGYYVKLPDAAGSVCFMHVPASNPDERNTAHYVALETVGQFTGLTDKNGVKIFEGDIVRLWGNGNNLKGVVEYSEAVWWVRLKECRTYLLDLYDESVIIGNIYDNPELIGGEENAEIH
ncbi:MAG: hypothetical protein IJ871_02725 [Ruminococcus sp.]|nr:hypothetical protein [Ruminococcus sp.]